MALVSSTSCVVSKWRAVRYQVGVREELETDECIAWVQKWISDGVNWRQFGKVQWKKLKTQDEGRAWVYEYAKERIARDAARIT